MKAALAHFQTLPLKHAPRHHDFQEGKIKPFLIASGCLHFIPAHLSNFILFTMPGSVAERVVRHAPCPVLVVRGDEPTAKVSA